MQDIERASRNLGNPELSRFRPIIVQLSYPIYIPNVARSWLFWSGSGSEQIHIN